MALKLGKDCHNTGTFIATHASAHAPANAPHPLPANHFIVDEDFFTNKSAAELQKIVDTTWKTRKKLNFKGNSVTVAAARTMLEQASSDSTAQVKVRWGLHQSEDRPAGVVGKCLHFTLQAHPNDWHLYLNTDGSRVGFMSNGAAAVNLVTIVKW